MSVDIRPIVNAAAVVPSDTVDLGVVTRRLYIGGGGDLKVTLIGGNVVTYVGLPAGGLLVIAAKRVWAAGTTATNVLAEW